MSNPTRRRSWTLALASLLLFAVTACGEALTSADTSIVESEPATSVPGDAVATTSSSTTVASSSAAKNDAADDSSGTVGAVFAEATFDVTVSEDVVYAQGLTHDEWDSDDAEPTDLLLDVYEPVRSDDVVMPALVVIHGGGFTGGSKEHRALTDMAYWFAERGWVAYSINYRLADDHGTLPSDYPDVPDLATDRQLDQWRALYPACRDAKAAIRWVKATADEYSVHPDHVAVIGGSAGSLLAVMLGVSDDADCTAEVSVDDDPTLVTTNLDQSSEVATVIDHWGSSLILAMLQMSDGDSRFDPTDAPVSIVHGTEDATVAFAEAERLRAAYDQTGVTYEWHPLDGAGHGPWGAAIDGQTLTESAADFIVETQSLEVR